MSIANTALSDQLDAVDAGPHASGADTAHAPTSPSLPDTSGPHGDATVAPAERIALITGGSRGLGRNTAEHLVAQGVAVVITYQRREDDARALVDALRANGGRVVALPLDVAEVGSFASFATGLSQALVQHFGRPTFDYLVNNAGHGVHASFTTTTPAQFDEMVNVHLKGPFFLTQALLPLLSDGGRIVNVSSGLTRFAFPGYAVYASVKGAVEVMTRYQAKGLAGRRITVNTLAPGAIETDFGGGVVRDNADLNRQIADLTALGRVGVPDDIGGAIASLLTEGNRWVNAQRIEVSGGIFI